MSERPRNIGLGSIIHYRFPIPAISSILHRISGILLFLFIPFMLWLLDSSLRSAAAFAHVKECFTNPLAKFFIWVFLSALIYHLIAGIKHMFSDMGYFEQLKSGRCASSIVILLSAVLIILLGVWLIW